VFTKNRQRLLDGDIAEEFLERVLSQAREKTLLSTIYVWTDNASLLRILPADPGEPVRDRIARLRPPVSEVLMQCAVCHELEGAGESTMRISLVGVYKQHIGRGPDRLYSQAFLAARDQGSVDEWDDSELDKFLKNPNGVVPGTTMASPGITDDATRREVIEFLKSLR
jgi:cytochrome c